MEEGEERGGDFLGTYSSLFFNYDLLLDLYMISCFYNFYNFTLH
jgi:hypothetical protein